MVYQFSVAVNKLPQNKTTYLLTVLWSSSVGWAQLGGSSAVLAWS